jgi:hypothetical protein
MISRLLKKIAKDVMSAEKTNQVSVELEKVIKIKETEINLKITFPRENKSIMDVIAAASELQKPLLREQKPFFLS